MENNLETMDVDILIVGGGISGIAAVAQLQNLYEKHNLQADQAEREPPIVVVLEKSQEIGSHCFSGAIVDPLPLMKLFPGILNEPDTPLKTKVQKEGLYFLTSAQAFRSPLRPEAFQNLGYYLVSVNELVAWMAKKVEPFCTFLTGFTAQEVIFSEGRLLGIRTGDRGLDKNFSKKNHFEPGLMIQPKATIFADGARGNCSLQIQKMNGKETRVNPDVYELGIKDLLKIPRGRFAAGEVRHLMGYPFNETRGGGFLYAFSEELVGMGVVGFLNTKDPLFDLHSHLQLLKAHPEIHQWLEGAEVIEYGAKVIPAGGWYSLPQLSGEGYVVCGDAAGFLNTKKLKGIHLAVQSGVLAADSVFEACVHQNFSAEQMKSYDEKIKKGSIGEELYKTRNFHVAASMNLGTAIGHMLTQEITAGRGFIDPMVDQKDSLQTETVLEIWGQQGLEDNFKTVPEFDQKLILDKANSVYLSHLKVIENSPNHLLIKDPQVCQKECFPFYKAPCTHFCPAGVYEINTETRELIVNYTNCIHCKTCDIKCPFENITWSPPEGGTGPLYRQS